jgi:hypothetical protein
MDEDLTSTGHPQDEHRTKHGSMDKTEWVIEGDDDAFLELQGRKFATGDTGAPMLCSMVCKAQNRHVHIAPCRAQDPNSCQEAGVEHIKGKNLSKEYDWISHKHFWARSGMSCIKSVVTLLLMFRSGFEGSISTFPYNERI